MFRRIAVVLACSGAFIFASSVTHAQFGGLQVQVGGFGSGVRMGNFGYGNGYYGRYGGGLGNPYYGNQFSSGFGGYNTYGNRGYYDNGRTYGRYSGSNYRYLSPRVYATPGRTNTMRRYRYR